jgi:PleD family two-component response regulator
MTTQSILEALAPSAPGEPMNGRPHPDDFPVGADMQIQRLVDDLRSVYAMQKRAQLAPAQKRKRVLVVEDHLETRQLICMTVQFEDYEVFEADSGDTGLAMALELKPDLVTLMQFPKRNGALSAGQARTIGRIGRSPGLSAGGHHAQQ